jgi:ABC-2 type transport system permease protein
VNPGRLLKYYLLSLRQLLRNRVAVILLIVLPTLFCTVIVLTTPERTFPLRFPAIDGAPVIPVDDRNLSVAFIGAAAVCLLTAFLGLHLVQKSWETDHRLVFAGYTPSELLVAKLSVLSTVILITGVYVASLVSLYYPPDHFAGMLLGFIAGGFVYGCYGLLIGSIVKRDLEGILCVLLLSNIDSSWLQNPHVYAEALREDFIQWLPGYHPVQASLTGAFSDHTILPMLVDSFVYGGSFLAVVLGIYAWRMGIRTSRRNPHPGEG